MWQEMTMTLMDTLQWTNQISHQLSRQLKTKKIKVTYEEYRTISNLIILHIRQQEESDKGMNDSHTNWHILHPQSLVACDRVSWSTGI